MNNRQISSAIDQTSPGVIPNLLVFGISGDLFARLLMPALATLWEQGILPSDFAIVGMSRKPMESASFRQQLSQRLASLAPTMHPATRDDLLARITYLGGNSADQDDVARALSVATRGNRPVSVYLAIPGSSFAATIRALSQHPLPTGSRIAVEKPFGDSLAAAQSLNRQLAESSADAYRIDFVLATRGINSLQYNLAHNPNVNSAWNGENISRIEVRWPETLGLEGRNAFYDETGALKDVVQNHLFQAMCVIAMEPGDSDPAQRRLAVMKSIEPVDIGNTIRARYKAGVVNGKRFVAYVDEEGIDPERRTETYAQIGVKIRNDRWNTTFRLAHGKAMGTSAYELRVLSRDQSGRIVMQSSDLRSDLSSAQLLPGVPSSQSRDAHMPSGEPMHVDFSPYTYVLKDILTGQRHYAVSAKEAEEVWRVLEPVCLAWAANKVPLLEYPAGISSDAFGEGSDEWTN